MTKPPRHEQIANCLACTLADVMRDCPACQFAPRVTRATPADVIATWRKLWGSRTPEDVARYTAHLPGEQYDQTQLTDEEISEMEN